VCGRGGVSLLRGARRAPPGAGCHCRSSPARALHGRDRGVGARGPATLRAGLLAAQPACAAALSETGAGGLGPPRRRASHLLPPALARSRAASAASQRAPDADAPQLDAALLERERGEAPAGT